MQFFLYN